MLIIYNCLLMCTHHKCRHTSQIPNRHLARLYVQTYISMLTVEGQTLVTAPPNNVQNTTDSATTPETDTNSNEASTAGVTGKIAYVFAKLFILCHDAHFLSLLTLT